MALLTNVERNMLYNQIENNNGHLQVGQLVSLINRYENLTIEDLRPRIIQDLYESLTEEFRDPQEVQAWRDIEQASQTTLEELKMEELRMLECKIINYVVQHGGSNYSKVNEANTKLANARDAIKMLIEQADWDNLDKGNYDALINYLNRYPQSIHKVEIDDLMWKTVLTDISIHKLPRYLKDMPDGRHREEANRTMNLYAEWEEIKNRREIIEIKDYLVTHPNSPFITEAWCIFYSLRAEELNKMKDNPSGYELHRLFKILDKGIFIKDDLIKEMLITERSWENMHIDRDQFPKLVQIPDPNIQSKEGCTDIYFFGIPSTGKTCLLMGLAGANGKGYSLNMIGNGGRYAGDLSQYVLHGITPGSTHGSFVTLINGWIGEDVGRGKVVRHPINLVEMSGEEFALRIANGEKPSFESMGTGVTNLLGNDNRKVFFIIVDPTRQFVPVNYLVDQENAEGEIVNMEIRTMWVSQMNTLARLTTLFELEENRRIMEKVDAVHIIVTKSDTLGCNCNEVALQLLQETYTAPVEQLKAYCRQSKRINYSTNFKPQVFSFSLGRFYLGDVYEFDSGDTLNLINTIKAVTFGKKEETWWDKFVKIMN